MTYPSLMVNLKSGKRIHKALGAVKSSADILSLYVQHSQAILKFIKPHTGDGSELSNMGNLGIQKCVNGRLASTAQADASAIG